MEGKMLRMKKMSKKGKGKAESYEQEVYNPESLKETKLLYYTFQEGWISDSQ